MNRRYKKLLLFFGLLAATTTILTGCSGQQTEDRGELIQRIQRQAEQLEMYI